MALGPTAGRKVANTFLKDTAPNAVPMRTVLESQDFKTASDFIEIAKQNYTKVV